MDNDINPNVSDIWSMLSLIDVAFIILVSEVFNMLISKLFPAFNQNNFLVRYAPGLIIGIIIDYYYRETLLQTSNSLMMLLVLVFLIIVVNRVKYYL